MTLFHIILVVVMSAVLVVSSPGHLIRLPPAVILTLLGSDFCGLISTTMRAYVGFCCRLGSCVHFLFQIPFATSPTLQGRNRVRAFCTTLWFLLSWGVPLLRKSVRCRHRGSCLVSRVMLDCDSRNLLASTHRLAYSTLSA